MSSAPVVVITGATRGIGAAAAVELARRGAEVAIVGREPDRVRAAAEAAREVGGPDAVVHEHVADLLAMDEVRRLASELLDAHPRIDVLANNAGAMFTSRKETPDGLERTFALNHAAGFLLTELLAERLAQSPGGGRVVDTASDAHTSGSLDLDDLQFARRRFSPMRVYGTTKLMNILHVRELSKRHSDLTAACFHPGVVRTGFGKNDGLLYKIGLTAAGPFLRTPAKGARSLVWLALDADPAAVDGAYVVDEAVKTPNAAAQDDVLAEALWERTSALLARPSVSAGP